MTLPECWQEFEDALNNGVNRIILFGPPGTGKTYAGLKMGNVTAGAFRLVCTEDMTSAEVTGTFMPASNGTFQWVSGAALKAWNGDGIVGGRLVADEIDKASGDVFGQLLAMMDSDDSAEWEHPESGRIHRPMPGFSAIMTTNIENMDDLPEALSDRFPVKIRINTPHPDALMRLSMDLRGIASRMADAGPRRVSLRTFMAFDSLRKGLGAEKAARMVFRDRAESILDAMRIEASV
jgi:MoxR-like ATPase